METDTENILEVNNLSVSFGEDTVLRDISFSVKKGSALAVIGPNGAGKSVLFKALLGLVSHDGDIHWQKGVKVGYVPQKFMADRTIPITVREFFLIRASRFWFSPKDFLSHLRHELALVGLSEKVLEQRMGELSGGQMQRILISWAMVNHPDVLLFDEPTAGVDVGGEETIYNLIHKMQDERGTTVLLISHDLSIVYRYVQNVLCVNKKMICQGPPQEVLSPEELSRLYGGGSFYHHIESQ